MSQARRATVGETLDPIIKTILDSPGSARSRRITFEAYLKTHTDRRLPTVDEIRYDFGEEDGDIEDEHREWCLEPVDVVYVLLQRIRELEGGWKPPGFIPFLHTPPEPGAEGPRMIASHIFDEALDVVQAIVRKKLPWLAVDKVPDLTVHAISTLGADIETFLKNYHRSKH